MADESIEESTSLTTTRQKVVTLRKFTGDFRNEFFFPLTQQAANSYTDVNQLGMLHMLLNSNEQWIAAGGEGDKPAAKERPAAVGANASAADTRAHAYHLKPYAAERAFEVAAQEAIKAALGPILFGQFQHPTTRLTNKTVAEMLHILEGKYLIS